MNPVELARSVTLTPAHIRQLEAGGDSMFYSPAIKLSVGRRLLKQLGSDLDEIEDAVPTPTTAAPEPRSPVTLPSRVGPTPVPVAPRQSTVPSQELSTAWSAAHASHTQTTLEQDAPQNIDRLRVAPVLHPLARWFPAATAMAAVAVVALVLYQVIKPWPAPSRPAPELARVQAPLVAQQATPAAEPSATQKGPAPAPSPAEARTDDASPVREAPAVAHCTAPPMDALALQAPSSTRPANYVHLVATQETVLCVIDGSSRATKVHLKPGDARSIYGAAPWRIHSPMPAAVDVYFQGHRMTGAIGTATNVVFTEHAVNAMN